MIYRFCLAVLLSVIFSASPLWATQDSYSFTIDQITFKNIPDNVSGFYPTCLVLSTEAGDKTKYPLTDASGANLYAIGTDYGYSNFFGKAPQRRASAMAGPFLIKAVKNAGTKASDAKSWWCGIMLKRSDNPTELWPGQEQDIYNATGASSVGKIQ